jgi:hypothetical protein
MRSLVHTFFGKDYGQITATLADSGAGGIQKIVSFSTEANF